MPLSSIKGTGPNGTIVKADIEEYLGTIVILSMIGVVVLFLFCFLLLENFMVLYHLWCEHRFFLLAFVLLDSPLSWWLNNCLLPYDAASRGKEVSAAAPSAKAGTPAALDYTDIPHSQIRKVIDWIDCYFHHHHHIPRTN